MGIFFCHAGEDQDVVEQVFLNDVPTGPDPLRGRLDLTPFSGEACVRWRLWLYEVEYFQ